MQLAVHVDMPAQMTHAYTALALPPAPAPAVTYWYVGWSSSPVDALIRGIAGAGALLHGRGQRCNDAV